MYTPNITKIPKQFYRTINDNNLIKSKYIEHRTLNNDDEDFLNIKKEKKAEKNLLLNIPIYKTLNTENYIENFNYQPSINFIESKENQFEKKFNTIINPSINNNVNKKIRSLFRQNFCFENRIEDNYNKSTLSNIYTNIYSPKRNEKSNLIKKTIDEDEFIDINNNSDKRILYKMKNNKNLNFGQNFDNNNFKYLGKRVINSKETINNIGFISNSIDTQRSDKNSLLKKGINNTKSFKFLKNDSKSKLIKYIPNVGQKIKFENNNFKKIDIHSSSHKNKLIKNEKSFDANKNLNNSLKSKSINNNQKSNIIIFKRRNNLKYNYLSNISKNFLYQKAVEILINLIKNKKSKFFFIFKYKLLRKKNNCHMRKLSIYKKLTKLTKIDIKSQRYNSYNTLTNSNRHNNSSRKNNMQEDSKNKLRNNINENSKYKELLKENLKLQNNISILIKDKEKLIKKLEINQKFSKNPRIMNLIIENKNLKYKLKNIYTKYLISKKINTINNKLKEILYSFNKKAFSIYYQELKKRILLLKLINNKINYNKQILGKNFFNFYYRGKLMFNNNKEFEEIKKSQIKKEKFLNIFYKKEKVIILTLKKYFDKLYFNSLNKNLNAKIENINIIDEKNYNNNNFIEDKKRKLKIIIMKIMNKINNNIIIRSMLKQWALRTKIINMKILLVKEENIKNIMNPAKNLIKNNGEKDIFINDLKKDNLVKGIKKLNNIFISYKKANENETKNNGSNTDININDDNNKYFNNLNKTEQLIYKIYGDKLKYKYDECIIEEKEEEQTEENCESSRIKKDEEKNNY